MDAYGCIQKLTEAPPVPPVESPRFLSSAHGKQASKSDDQRVFCPSQRQNCRKKTQAVLFYRNSKIIKIRIIFWSKLSRFHFHQVDLFIQATSKPTPLWPESPTIPATGVASSYTASSVDQPLDVAKTQVTNSITKTCHFDYAIAPENCGV